MPKLMLIEELKEYLKIEYNRELKKRSRILRKENIDAFNNISRAGLSFNDIENRLYLYTTLTGERICIQFPGKESQNSIAMPLDFRPRLMYKDGSIMQDASFGFIWDIIEGIGRLHKDYLSLVATMFFYLGYMCRYEHITESYYSESVIVNKNGEIATPAIPIELSWNRLSISDDVWYSLNNYIQAIPIPNNQSISFEGFIKFVDLLLQNEDCKYFYRNVSVNGNVNYQLTNGRTNTADANLLVIDFLEEHKRISNLLNCFQKARGVPTFKKDEYPIVTGGIVSKEAK